MPKETEYRIAWSSELTGYEVNHGPFRFPLKDAATLHWWMGKVEAFHFCSCAGYTMTLRKEQKRRGSAYWYAYKRVEGTLYKQYVGKTDMVSLVILEAVARCFVEPEPVKQQVAPPRKPTLTFTRTLQSALKIYGFPTVPTRKQLLTRYRELSKQHHPDVGGLHEDMVAVNLAYDYLKRFVK